MVCPLVLSAAGCFILNGAMLLLLLLLIIGGHDQWCGCSCERSYPFTWLTSISIPSSAAIIGCSAAVVHFALTSCPAAHDAMVYAGVGIGAGSIMLVGAIFVMCLFPSYVRYC